MTAPPPRDAQPPVDRGTGLGPATRVLTGTLTTTYRSAMVLRGPVGFVFTVLATVVALAFGATAVVGLVLIAFFVVWAIVVEPVREALPAAAAWPVIGLALAGAAVVVRSRHVVARFAARSAMRMWRILGPASRPIRRIARAARRAIAAVVLSASEIANRLTRGTLEALAVISAPLLREVRKIAFTTMWLGRRAAAAGRSLLGAARAAAVPIERCVTRIADVGRVVLESIAVTLRPVWRPIAVRPGLWAGIATLGCMVASPYLPALTLLVLLLGGFAAWRLLKLVARMLQRAGRHRRRRVAHSLQVASAKARLAAGTRNTAPPLGAIATARPVDVPPPPFELAVHQNRYLLGGGVDVDAIVTVTCEGAAEAAVEAAEVILVDRSGSMAYPLDKLRGARRATAAAIDALREGTWFAVVRATDTAQPLFPRAGLVEATPESKAQAKKALRLLWAEGGTALGKWLLMADDLLTARPYAIRHAILLTDGRNENESEEELDAALAACRGRFQCDCRGVGTDWEVGELRRIASAMVGTVDIVAEPAQLEDDFRALVERAMAKRTRDVTLRLWTPRGAEVRFVRQVSPQIETLAECVGGAGPLLTDVSTGAWSEETRAYHVSLRVPGHEPGEDMLAGAVSVLVDGLVVGRALIRATWTEDAGVAAEIAPELAHYRSQTELASSIRMGLEARREGDDRRATVMLGRAVRLAAESGNDATMRLLERLVEVEDPATGRVCLRGGVDDADEMALDTRSTRSVPIGARAP